MMASNTCKDKPTTFFYAALDCFKAAAENTGGTTDRTYNVAGHIIRMEFASAAMIPFITSAVEHLRVENEDEPALRICIWDSTTTNSSMIPSPWTKEAFAQHGYIPEYNTERIYTIFQPGEDTLNMLDAQANIAIFWRRNIDNVPFYTVGSPLRSIFHWWMHNNKRQLLHAAAAGHADGGVLIVGKGGSGKSTTALSCLQSDLLYVGDDYTLLSLEPEPFVHSLYSTAKLNTGHIEQLPFLVPLTHNQQPSEEDKYVILLNQHHPEKISPGFPVKAIVMPRVSGRSETTFKRSSAAMALAALAPSTLFQMTRGRSQSFQTLATLARQLPAFVLECGTDIPQIPGIINAILRQAT